ncbi:hypothetical protein B0G69_2202 [Paraburkholderia sp. RAU2J]|nr:hypothetical protein B0G69_2202 [Paraburkholderia sp. RAU2J]
MASNQTAKRLMQNDFGRPNSTALGHAIFTVRPLGRFLFVAMALVEKGHRK